MKKKYLSKFMLYKAVSKTLFKSVTEITKINKLMFSVTSQNKYKFGSSLVLNYILIKLGQYFNINEIVNPLSYFIKHLTCIAGYKILIRGRLTRKERAAVMIRSGKKMPLSTISANVDYSQGSKIMKFGMVGIKVYLLLKPSTLINLYRFSFKFK
jgi:ribosomal protein S3